MKPFILISVLVTSAAAFPAFADTTTHLEGQLAICNDERDVGSVGFAYLEPAVTLKDQVLSIDVIALIESCQKDSQENFGFVPFQQVPSQYSFLISNWHFFSQDEFFGSFTQTVDALQSAHGEVPLSNVLSSGDLDDWKNGNTVSQELYLYLGSQNESNPNLVDSSRSYWILDFDIQGTKATVTSFEQH